MYRINIKQRILAVLAAGAFTAISALGAPITVSNASFETLPPGGLLSSCGPGCTFSQGSPIPGWTTTDTSTSGEFRPGSDTGNFTFFNTIPDGITVGYSNGPTISQTVVPTVQLGVVYTLVVDLGRRKDTPFVGSADLLINGNVISALGVAPTPGNWSSFTATYTGLAADAGQAITIELKTSGSQGDFDNVRLSDNVTTGAVPEPATATIFGLGLVGILAYARRKRTF